MPSLSTTSSAHRTCCDASGCCGVSSARRRRVGGAEGPEALLVMVWEPEVGALLEVRRWVGGWLDIVMVFWREVVVWSDWGCNSVVV